MNIIVSGHQLDLGTALQHYVSEKLTRNIQKILEKTISAYVALSKQRQHYSCHIAVNEASTRHQNYIDAHGEGYEIYASFENAYNKLQHILRTDRSKLKSHKATKLSVLPQNIIDE